MKRLLMPLICVAVLLSAVGCASEETQQNHLGYDLYFLESDLDLAAGEGVLRPEQISLPVDVEAAGDRQLAEALVKKLLEGPEDLSLKNTIPIGTTLLSLEIQGTEAIVDFSVAYAGLSGIALTMADYAVAMTLTQLPNIMSVRITVHGRELAYRDRQIFTVQDVLLAPEGDVLGTVDVRLYFLSEYDTLRSEDRTLEIYEGDTQVATVIRALENGPQNKALSGIWPEEFRIRAVWQEEDICYVNLSSALLETLPEGAMLDVTLQSLGDSLCSLESVTEVRFLVDGEFSQTYGSVDISESHTR